MTDVMAATTPSSQGLYVMKRNGKQQPVSFDKITERIQALCDGTVIGCEPLPDLVSPILVAQKVCSGVFPGVTTAELDDLAAETACYMSTDCPEYSNLAARIAISNLHKGTSDSFINVMTRKSDTRPSPSPCVVRRAGGLGPRSPGGPETSRWRHRRVCACAR